MLQSGSQLLREWQERRGYNQAQAAEALGLTESFYSMLVNKERVPGRETSIRIELTAGIPVRAWSPLSADDNSPELVKTGGNKRRVHKG